MFCRTGVRLQAALAAQTRHTRAAGAAAAAHGLRTRPGPAAVDWLTRPVDPGAHDVWRPVAAGDRRLQYRRRGAESAVRRARAVRRSTRVAGLAGRGAGPPGGLRPEHPARAARQ